MPKPTTHQELLRLIDQAADECWEELDLSELRLEELPQSIGLYTNSPNPGNSAKIKIIILKSHATARHRRGRTMASRIESMRTLLTFSAISKNFHQLYL
jgi:hypothetical protein